MIRVLIADDHAVVRRGIREVLEESADIRVRGEASNAHEVLELLKQGPWDVVWLYITPTLAERLASMVRTGFEGAPHELLSEREFRVFRQLSGGKTVTEIAEAMNLSVKTVSTYRARALEKLGLKSNAELTQYAI